MVTGRRDAQANRRAEIGTEAEGDFDKASARDGRLRPLADWMRGPQRDVGEEPDYRFSFANERTLLAWIRTALALVAGGLVIIQVFEFPIAREVLGVALVGLGAILAAGSYGRWLRAEDAMRLKQPLPASRLPGLVAFGVMLVSALAVVLFLIAG